MLEVIGINFILSLHAWILNKDEVLSAGRSTAVDITRDESHTDATEDMILPDLILNLPLKSRRS